MHFAIFILKMYNYICEKMGDLEVLLILHKTKGLHIYAGLS